MPSRCSTVKVCQCPVGALLLVRSVGSGKREQNQVRVWLDTMMMNDEQKLAPSGFANTPSIVPNYTANRRGARIDTRPATDCPWKRWATHEGPMRPSVWSIHILPPREKEAEFQTRTKTKFRGAADDN